MDEPMENPGFDEEEELNEFIDDDQDEEVEEWLMASVTPPRATMTYCNNGDPSSSDYFGGAGTDPADLISWSLVAEPAVTD
nr:hypothetical protein [Tanacetum cinerariifolium]